MPKVRYQIVSFCRVLPFLKVHITFCSANDNRPLALLSDQLDCLLHTYLSIVSIVTCVACTALSCSSYECSACSKATTLSVVTIYISALTQKERILCDMLWVPNKNWLQCARRNLLRVHFVVCLCIMCSTRLLSFDVFENYSRLCSAFLVSQTEAYFAD